MSNSREDFKKVALPSPLQCLGGFLSNSFSSQIIGLISGSVGYFNLGHHNILFNLFNVTVINILSTFSLLQWPFEFDYIREKHSI